MKFWKIGFLSVFVLLIAFGGYFYSQLRALEVEKLSEDLFVLRGMGGNTTVLKTDAGNVIVDTMTTGTQGQQIRRKAKQLTGMDTVLLINTHYHLDHTHGNPAFDVGTRVVSTERTLFYLKETDGEFWSDGAENCYPMTPLASVKR